MPGVTAVDDRRAGVHQPAARPTQAWRDELATILAEGERYGRSTVGAGERVNVEYVSANPTGPMHMGHCRGAVVGDALASLLEAAGFAVTREYYVNDAGSQVDTLARSAHLRYREALGEDIGEIPEGLYPGDYLKPVGDSARRRIWRPLTSPRPRANGSSCSSAKTVAAMIDLIRHDLALARHPPRHVRVRGRAAGGGRARPRRWRRSTPRGWSIEGVLEAPKGLDDA